MNLEGENIEVKLLGDFAKYINLFPATFMRTGEDTILVPKNQINKWILAVETKFPTAKITHIPK
jgi:hypothetical protein